MKIRNILILTALILAVFCLGACGLLNGSDGQGSIVINFGGAARAGADEDYIVNTNGMSYTITLTSSGKPTIEEVIDDISAPVSISVSEGTWIIKVEAAGDRVIGRQKDEDGVSVTVTAGEPTSVIIEMTVTETRVYDWEDLVKDFKGINNGKLPNLEYIEIVGKPVSGRNVLTAYSSANDDSPSAINLTKEQTITLWAKTTVYIERDTTINDTTNNNNNINITVFTIKKGTLILDGTKGDTENGEIIIDGKKDVIASCKRALINVTPSNTDSATLIMRNGTLTNNRTEYGGGVYVSGTNACFRMEGGVISKNIATNYGGGVCVMTSGCFENIAGTIYGGDGEENNNTAGAGRERGNAVCYVAGSGTNPTVRRYADETVCDDLYNYTLQAGILSK